MAQIIKYITKIVGDLGERAPGGARAQVGDLGERAPLSVGFALQSRILPSEIRLAAPLVAQRKYLAMRPAPQHQFCGIDLPSRRHTPYWSHKKKAHPFACHRSRPPKWYVFPLENDTF